MNHVTFSSEVPAGHAVRFALQGALKQGALRLRGNWSMSLRDARGGGWWLLRVEGPDFCRTLIVEPAEQKPATILTRLEECLREAGAEFRDPDPDGSLSELFDDWSVPSRPRNAD
jgi:hypothetical protein